MTTAAKHLRKRGLIVVGADTATVLANLARAKEDCHGLTDAFEITSQSIQKQAALQFYLLPTLAGIKEGALAAYRFYGARTAMPTLPRVTSCIRSRHPRPPDDCFIPMGVECAL
jgi:type IV secretory pathway VirJ component